MKHTRTIISIALALSASSMCLAQTGIMDQSAEYRKIPLQARLMVKDNPELKFEYVLDSLNQLNDYPVSRAYAAKKRE